MMRSPKKTCRFVSRFCSAALVALAVSATLISSPHTDAASAITAETLSKEQIDAAIAAMVRELYARLDRDSFWEPTAGRGDGSQFQTWGHTALVTLALLYAGESYQNRDLREVIDHLQDVKLEGTYAVATRANVWAILPPRFQEELEADFQWLVDGFSPEAGGWAYYKNPTTTVRDNSLRQFGALGWWAASMRGLRVSRDHWAALERGFIDMQLADGGWGYRPRNRTSTGSMTAAGLAALFITQDFLHARDALELNRDTTSRHEQAIENGLQWMDRHFSATENPGRDDYFYYYLYGVERVALASGYKYFGGKDWYLEGAAELLRRFGRWDAEAREFTMFDRAFDDGRRRQFRIEELAFGLMFLTRGYAPPVMNKINDPDTHWNNRPRDVANLTFWLAEETARHLFWQIVDISAPAEDWLDAPLAYFASHRAIPWVQDLDLDVERYVQRWRAAERMITQGIGARPDVPQLPQVPQLHQIHEYLDRGGMLLAIQEGSGRAFTDSILTIGRLLYPQYDWKPLADDHWAYTAHRPVRGNRPRGRVLSNGARDLIVLITDQDITATFQVRQTDRRAHYDTVSNIFFYASEMNRPRSRLESLNASRGIFDEQIPRAEAQQINLARGMYHGNWNAEPAALDRFAEAVTAHDELTLDIRLMPLARLDELRTRSDLVIVGGTDPHEFTDDERDDMERFVRGGGTILFETVGGQGRFAHAAERQLADVFGRTAEPLLRHPIITGDGVSSAVDCSTIDLRPYSLTVLGAIETSPRLRGIMIEGHPRVLFSREDLSHALLNQPCWGMHGYTTESAHRLLRNIVLYAASAD